MKDRRQFRRNTLPQQGKFFGVNGWEDCLITEVSRKGLGVTFYTHAKINEGSIIHLKVVIPSEPEPIRVKGLLRWIEPHGEYFVGGIEWFSINKDAQQV